MTQSRLTVSSAMDDMALNAKAKFRTVDAARVRDFIASQPDVRGEVQIVSSEPLTAGAGASNGILLFTAALDRGSGTREEELVLRFDPGVKPLFKQKVFADEFHTLRAANAAGCRTPDTLWLDADGVFLGTPGFVMARIHGDAPASAFLNRGLLREAPAAARRAMMLEAAGFHGRLRGMAIPPAEVPHLTRRGVGTAAIERELNWWLAEIRASGAHDDPHRRILESTWTWMVEHQPSVYPAALVHGDAQFANVIFHDGQIAAVIDWELAYIGHNEADLALQVHLAEWHSEQSGVVDGVPTENDFVERYERESGELVEGWEFFRAFIIFKAATCSFLLRANFPVFEDVWASQWRHLEGALRRAGWRG